MKKVCLTILLIIVMMLSSITIVNADVDQSARFSLTTTNTDVKVGDEVTVNLVINSISGFSGIKTFTATKVFDSTIFEYKGCIGQNGWEVKGDETNIVLRNESTSSSGTIAILTFKVLKPVDNETIALKNVDASGDDGDVYFDDNNVNSPSISFKVTDAVTPDPDPDPEPEPDPEPNTNTIPDTNTNTTPDTNTNTTPDTNTNKVPNTNTNKVNNDKTTAGGGKIPQTGESYVATALVFVGIILVGIFYTKYKMYENKMK